MSLGLKIRELRAERDWTQNELAKRSGIDRGYLASIETDKVANPFVNIFLKLARAFNIRPEELYQAAGYIKDVRSSYQHQETSGEIVQRLTLALPVSIPIYPILPTSPAGYPFDPSKWIEPIAYIHRDRDKTKKSLEGYLIYGGKRLLDPIIKDEDIIIVDREGEIDNGNIVICLFEDTLQLGKIRKIDDELWLENNFGRMKFEECQVPAPVIEIIRRLK